MFPVVAHATAGWLLKEVNMKLQEERDRGREVPVAIGLKVVGAPSKAPALAEGSSSVQEAMIAASCPGLCAGEKLTAKQVQAFAKDGCLPFITALSALGGDDGALILDYNSPLEDALGMGEAFEV